MENPEQMDDLGGQTFTLFVKCRMQDFHEELQGIKTPKMTLDHGWSTYPALTYPPQK